MWRQGDILIQRVDALPDAARLQPLRSRVLVVGDVTSQRHMIKEKAAARLFADAQSHDLFLDVVGEHATVIHPEHAPIPLPHGVYRVWRQREFFHLAPRPVAD